MVRKPFERGAYGLSLLSADLFAFLAVHDSNVEPELEIVGLGDLRLGSHRQRPLWTERRWSWSGSFHE